VQEQVRTIADTGVPGLMTTSAFTPALLMVIEDARWMCRCSFNMNTNQVGAGVGMKS
jgi:hypothetical protein